MRITRFDPSRTTANASGRRSSSVAPCASRLDQLSVAVGSLIGVLSGIDLVQQDNTHSENGDTRGALQEALAVVRRACVRLE